MSRKILGSYSDGKTSKTVEAVLRLDAAGRLSVAPIDPTAPSYLSGLPIGSYQIESKLGSAPRVVNFPTGAVFTTSDHSGIDELLKRTGQGFFQRLLALLENNLPTAIAATLVTVFLGWYAVIYGVPAVATQVAFMLPASAERMIGQGTLDAMDKVYFDPTQLSDDEINRLREKFEPILSQYTELEPVLEFRDGKMGANAFALPSGIILFTDEIVGLAQNDEQLLSVLYHEIGHLQHRHVLRRTLQGSILTVLAVFITGDISGVNEIVAAIPAVLIDASYSRDFESEADEFAITQMRKSGLPLSEFASMLRLLEDSQKEALKKEGVEMPRYMDFLQTHPGTDERIDAIRDRR